jgi:hypothetical protein
MITLSPLKAHSLRKLVCILLLLIIALQSFNKAGIMLAFKMNQDYIANALCENNDHLSEIHLEGFHISGKDEMEKLENNLL